MIIKSLEEKNYCAKVNYIPAKRAIFLLKSGRYDGEIGRINEYESEVSDFAIRVPTPIYTFEGIFISHKKMAKEDIKKIESPIGIVRGIRWIEQMLEENQIENKYTVNEYSYLIKPFNTGRINYLFYPKELYKKEDFKREHHSMHMNYKELYLWLHKKNESKMSFFNELLLNSKMAPQ